MARRSGLAEVASDGVMFQDRYSCTAGLDDLDAHLTASRMYMPGITLTRVGDARQCQGAALADWEACDREGKAVGKGTNLFVLSPEGKIARVVGFWAA